MEFFSGGGWVKPALLSILFWGLWGFLTKLGAERTSWQTMMVFSAVCTLGFSFIAGPEKLRLDLPHLIALSAGIAGALGFLFCFIALSRGPATVVIPTTSLYIVISSLLAFLLLQEAFTVKKVLGIASAVLAIFLLAG